MAAPARRGLDLELRDLVVAYADSRGDARRVLAVPEFHLDAGEQMAICGPSGSGKTTLFNLLAGIERPRGGTVRWGPVTVSSLAERAGDRWRRETLGLVFQQFHLFEGMSPLENVLLPLRFEGWSVEPALRVDARRLLERVGVPPDADSRRLSRGELQRVALARALLRRPRVVLADEPTASLDRDTADGAADLLCGLCSDAGATLIVATHDLQLASRFGKVVDVVHGDLLPRCAAPRSLRLAPVA